MARILVRNSGGSFWASAWPKEGGKFGYPFRERGKENPKGPVILKVGEGLLDLLAGHSSP
jgi:hypothetical protein